jgi:hypothetical protein
MSFESGWKPSTENGIAPPCALVKPFIDGNVSPDFRNPDHVEWTLQKLGPQIVHLSESLNRNLLESAVMIWRYREMREMGKKDASWKFHVKSWIVRSILP